MAREIVMPQMGAEMEEGTIIRWTKQPGELIHRGEVIGEIETDKATVDLESFDEGYFVGAAVPDGTTLKVGEVIGYLGEQGEAMPAGAGGGQAPTQGAARPVGQPSAGATDAMPAHSGQTAPTPAQAGEGQGRPEAVPGVAGSGRDGVPGRGAASVDGRQPVPLAADGSRIRVSPVARSLAAELGVTLVGLKGSGPDGRIMRRDVEAAAQARPAAAAGVQAAEAVPPAQPVAPAARQGEAVGAVTVQPAAAAATPTSAGTAPQPATPARGIEPLSRMRQTIARRMAAAKREIPHYYLTMSADMAAALALRRQLNATLPDEAHVSVNDLIIKACALALEQHSRFNMSFSDEGLRVPEAINIGIAVALDDGLVVPAVLNCRGKSLGAIAREARDVAERARSGRLRAAELSDGTFTVSNLGMYGVETLVAIIQPGQSAVLGVGKVEPRPVVRDGQVVAREMMTIALSADHRVTNGAEGARFLATIRDLLEQPFRLML